MMARKSDRRRLNGRTPKGTAIEDRFWVKVGPADAMDCWVWTAALRKGTGYGDFRVEGKNVLAHRWAYEYMVGPIPDGLHLDHLCRNRACVNPWHLDPVTPLVNTRRGQGHGSETHCPSGHAYDGDNVYRWGGRRYCRACKKPARSRDISTAA